MKCKLEEIVIVVVIFIINMQITDICKTSGCHKISNQNRLSLKRKELMTWSYSNNVCRVKSSIRRRKLVLTFYIAETRFIWRCVGWTSPECCGIFPSSAPVQLICSNALNCMQSAVSSQEIISPFPSSLHRSLPFSLLLPPLLTPAT